MGKRKNASTVIKPPEEIDRIQSIDKNNIFDENYPLFCFKYLSDISISNCRDHKFFVDFLCRLQKLSSLGWNEIRKSSRHSFGMEPIPVSRIRQQLPTCVTPDVQMLHVFRACGDNRPFIGLQVGRIFRVFFIEAKFGDIYNH